MQGVTLNLYGRNFSLEAALKATLQFVLGATKNQKSWQILIHAIENDQNLSKKETRTFKESYIDFDLED